jgi:rubrerythrin
MKLKGTKTEKNLREAFLGESEARTKYTFYASKAKKEGYNEISDIFTETAANEKEHAEIWFKLLMGGEIKSTEENLVDAVAGENYEATEMYVEFAKVAKKEGFDRISFLFDEAAKIEAEHEKRYARLLEDLRNNRVFEKTKEVVWICTNCGYIHYGKKAPEVCPFCDHSRAYFKVR